MLRLFHFSDQDDIEVFVPKPVDVPSRRPAGQEWLNGPLNWAVDETRQAAYLFPRECPRIVLWSLATSSDEDRSTYFGERGPSMVAYVERAWLDTIERHVLYRYELPTGTFSPTDDEWMWVSRDRVVPMERRRLDNLTGALVHEDTELRTVDSLVTLRDLWSTSLHVSGIRLRNAPGWPLESVSRRRVERRDRGTPPTP